MQSGRNLHGVDADRGVSAVTQPPGKQVEPVGGDHQRGLCDADGVGDHLEFLPLR